jgi:hypothetical protein
VPPRQRARCQGLRDARDIDRDACSLEFPGELLFPHAALVQRHVHETGDVRRSLNARVEQDDDASSAKAAQEKAKLEDDVLQSTRAQFVLLDYLAEQASGCRVARASGVESEMELAYAGLHQLLAPMLARLERLPAPQGEALVTAFGLSSGAAPDRFLVGLATLSLLAEVAEEPHWCA